VKLGGVAPAAVPGEDLIAAEIFQVAGALTARMSPIMLEGDVGLVPIP
jgi:hypothetical protein